jgi:hypothetical protein
MQTIATDKLDGVNGGALESRTELLNDAINKRYSNDYVEIGTPSFSGSKATVGVKTSPHWYTPWTERTCTANVYKEDQGFSNGVYGLECPVKR